MDRVSGGRTTYLRLTASREGAGRGNEVAHRETTQPARLWVVSQALGAASEVWILRQVERFRALRPMMVCWERCNEDWYSLEDVEIVQVPYPAQPHEGPGRWWYRTRQAHRQNFYGTAGGEARFLMRLAKERRPAVMLAHFGHLGLRVLRVAQKLAIPLVVHFHGLDLSSMLRNRWYRWSLKANLGHFAAMVVVGTRQRAVLQGLGAASERIHLIPCGVPTEEFVPANVIETERPLRFLCVSRLTEFKGIRECVLAFASVAGELPGSELVIVGDGEERESLEAIVRERNLGHRVLFTGALPPHQVREWLQRSSVFLQHSVNGQNGSVEGFGVAVAEAAATGLPVIASRCGGLIDQIVDGETGLLVDQRDIQAMARAMVRLAIEPDLRARMGRAGRARTIALYDTAKQVAKLEDVLMEVAR